MFVWNDARRCTWDHAAVVSPPKLLEKVALTDSYSESCEKWLHAQCCGFDGNHGLPKDFVCQYCTQTPLRGGRIRDPRRNSININTNAAVVGSPLAHKSGPSLRGRVR
jgi:hypothetical protein